MNASNDVARAAAARLSAPDFDSVFNANYLMVIRAIDRVIGDHARAEDIAIEAFWKLWQRPDALGQQSGGWLRRTAIRLALDELRRRMRRARYESLFAALGWSGAGGQQPDEIMAASDDQARVRMVLGSMRRRDAELLLLQSDGLHYQDIATFLSINPASVGTLLARARRVFREAYEERYGDQQRAHR